jgi:hypothetical protein
MPTSRKVIEDRHANERRQSEILRDITAECHALREAPISPIFMAVKEAIAGLRAEGCGNGSHCALRVASDLEENAEPAFKAILDNRSGIGRLPGEKLNNNGIEVLFCGLAATGGGTRDTLHRTAIRCKRRDSRREDRLQQVWSSAFTNPGDTKFEPFCPTWSDTGLSREVALQR